MMRAPVYVALLHHPIRSRHGGVVTTSITNMDIHDIARSGRTFGIRRFFVVHPIPGLRALSDRVIDHWRNGYGSRYNPSRREAMELVEAEPDLDHVLAAVEQDCGELPQMIATSARNHPEAVTFEELRRKLEEESRAHLLLLGTGHGIADEVLARAELRLEPIEGARSYNHLSVRAAAAIIFDRLLGTGPRTAR